MGKNELRRSLIARLFAICVVLQMAVSALAVPYWEATPLSDVAPYGADLTWELHTVVAKDGFVYETSAYGTLYRWSKALDWELVGTFYSNTNLPWVLTSTIKANSMYFGGYFDYFVTAYGQTNYVKNIAKFDLCSLACFPVGNGSITAFGSLAGEARAVTAIVLDNQNNVYAAVNARTPSFQGNYKSNPESIVKCNGTGSWTQLGHGLKFGNDGRYMSYLYQPGVGIRDLATDGNNVFACGRFLGGYNSDNSYVPSAGIIKWNGVNWQTMGNTAVIEGQVVGGIFDAHLTDASYYVNSIAVSGTNVFITGNFYSYHCAVLPSPGGCSLEETVYENSSVGQGLARFSTSGALLEANILHLHAPSGLDNPGKGWGHDLAVQSDGTVYLGGLFDQIDSVTGLQGMAKWQGAGWGMVDGMNGDLLMNDLTTVGRARSVAADSAAIYVNGFFGFAGGVAVTDSSGDAMARWVTGSNPDPYPRITTIVGDHDLGGTYSGDEGPALSAGLHSPHGLAFYGGNLVIADTYNSAIRLVNSSGNISSPLNSYSFSAPVGVALDGNGYFYVADADWGTMRQFQGGNDEIHLDYNMYLGCALDSSGNLYGVQGYGDIAKLMHCVIPYGGSADGIVTTMAGNGTAGYSGDTGPAIYANLSASSYFYHGGDVVVASLTIDNQGNVYIADIGNNVVRKVDTSGIITTVAGNYNLGGGYSGDGGSAVNAQLLHPAAVAVDARGNLYIADSGNNRIRRVDSLTGTIRTIAGTGTAGYSGDNGPAINATLKSPAGLAFDTSGNLYISDTANDVIRKVTFNSCNP